MPQLSPSQRYEIEVLKRLKYGVSKISEHTGIPKSTVSRELKRNSQGGKYEAARAVKLASKRRQRGAYKLKGDLLERVEADLAKKDSPEQISGRLKQEGQPGVSHEAIYLLVYKDRKAGGELFKNLRFGRRKRRKRLGRLSNRGKIPNKTMIDERPKVVDEKSRFGDYEGDTVIGGQHQGVLVTLVERKSKLTLTAKAPDKSADAVQKVVVDLLKNSPIPVTSLTFDNGTEFANHLEIAQLIGAPIYFAHPYHSWERGLNENTNGLIRQFIPKKQNIHEVPDETILTIQNNLNNRPRKLLGFLSPIEFFNTAAVKGSSVAFET